MSKFSVRSYIRDFCYSLYLPKSAWCEVEKIVDYYSKEIAKRSQSWSRIQFDKLTNIAAIELQNVDEILEKTEFRISLSSLANSKPIRAYVSPSEKRIFRRRPKGVKFHVNHYAHYDSPNQNRCCNAQEVTYAFILTCPQADSCLFCEMRRVDWEANKELHERLRSYRSFNPVEGRKNLEFYMVKKELSAFNEKNKLENRERLQAIENLVRELRDLKTKSEREKSNVFKLQVEFEIQADLMISRLESYRMLFAKKSGKTQNLNEISDLIKQSESKLAAIQQDIEQCELRIRDIEIKSRLPHGRSRSKIGELKSLYSKCKQILDSHFPDVILGADFYAKPRLNGNAIQNPRDHPDQPSRNPLPNRFDEFEPPLLLYFYGNTKVPGSFKIGDLESSTFLKPPEGNKCKLESELHLTFGFARSLYNRIERIEKVLVEYSLK